MAVANEVRLKPRPSAAGDVPAEHSPLAVQRLRTMMLIRRFEERTYREYSTPIILPDGRREMKIGGFCHLYSGQEAIAVGTAALFDPATDYLINGYRCHGHSLALGMSPRAAMAELFGKATGCSKGKGGSMHLFDAQTHNMGGHAIVGGQVPLGVGLAFSQWYRNNHGVTFTFLGDGAVNQGVVSEALNLAGLYRLPVIFIVENNGVAMGTQVERSTPIADLAERGRPFGIPSRNVDGNDLDIVIAEFAKAVDLARSGGGPSYLVANTFRFRGHSMSDAMKYRTKEAAENAKQRDPILLYELRLRDAGLITDQQIEAMLEEITQEVDQAVRQAEQDPQPQLDDRFNDILSEQYPLQK